MQLKAGTATGCRLPKSWNKSFIHIQIETWNTVLIVRIFVILSGSVGVTSVVRYLAFTLFERRNLQFFVQKFNFNFPRKIVELFSVKTRENAAVWDFLAVDVHEKDCQKKNWAKNSRKCLGFPLFSC